MGLPSRASKSMVDNDRDKGRVNIKAVNKYVKSCLVTSFAPVLFYSVEELEIL